MAAKPHFNSPTSHSVCLLRKRLETDDEDRGGRRRDETEEHSKKRAESCVVLGPRFTYQTRQLELQKPSRCDQRVGWMQFRVSATRDRETNVGDGGYNSKQGRENEGGIIRAEEREREREKMKEKKKTKTARESGRRNNVKRQREAKVDRDV